MRRGLLIAAIAVLVLTVALWIAAKVDRSPLTRSAGNKRVPTVVAGRDLSTARPAPVREADEGAIVRCRYDGEGDGGRLSAVGDGVIDGPEGGGDLSIALPPGSWNIIWMPPDSGGRHKAYTLGTIEAAGGEVHTCSLVEGGWEVRGRVVNPQGRGLAGVGVTVCGERVRTDEDGRFTGVAAPGTCRVRAIVTDGLLSRRSEIVEVGPFDARAIELVVDDGPIAGMGIAFRMANGGARVLTVHAGTPADEAGLEDGDLIVSIDGTRTADLSDDAFIALGTGPEGSRVEVEVERDGERHTLRFNRERLHDPDDDELGELEDTGRPVIRSRRSPPRSGG